MKKEDAKSVYSNIGILKSLLNGDNIITYITMFILSTTGILLAINKKRKISN